ncbi:hypothetical protein, partial [Nocardioides sp.]|uniref:hypothetical protein n=1 Tax=Nocardioides sp. TaxID=35761 RepID=UPI002732FEA6
RGARCSGGVRRGRGGLTVLAVGAWLIVVGFCDLMRAARDTTTGWRRGTIATTGTLLLVLAGLLVGLEGSEWLGLGACGVAAYLLWLLGSSAALQGHTATARVVAFSGLGLGLVVTVLGGGIVDAGPALPSAWDDTLIGGLSPDLLVLGAGVLLVQLSTANIVVRLVLDAVGVPATTNEKQLKGGRLLGPMERLFLVVLGVGGYVTAAAVVVAAKGLLRFPELQRGVEAEGPSDVTEYFLIGSFASWLFALGGAALLWLAG